MSILPILLVEHLSKAIQCNYTVIGYNCTTEREVIKQKLYP